MRGSANALAAVTAVFLVGTACVMETEPEVGRSAYAVADAMLAEGIDPGAVVDDGPEVACVCGTGISSACEYVYYPAASVCFPWDDQYDDVYATNGTVRNENLTYHRLVECSMGTIYYYLGFYDPTHLHDVAVYTRKPTSGTDDISIDMYAATMTDNSWEFQDDCDLTSASSNPQQTRCYTGPLDSGQVLVSFAIDLPDVEGGGDYYIQGFRLCYDPDGW